MRSLSLTERAGVVERCGSVLHVDLAALARVTEENVKRKQKPRAHASDRDFVSTGVKQSRRAHQSDRKESPGARKDWGPVTR